MKIIFFLFSITLIQEYVIGQTQTQNDVCFNSIRILANKDKCLSSRLNSKIENAKIATSAQNFYDLVYSKYRCDGLYYQSNPTMSYVTEVFEGLQNQFNEYQKYNPINGTDSGYVLLNTKQALLDAMKNFTALSYPVIYHMRFTGFENHAWTIEQLASQGGFRIYQNYDDAYSLKSWLSSNTDLLTYSGDISPLNRTKEAYNRFVLTQTAGKYNLYSDATTMRNDPSISGEIKGGLPLLNYVRDYSISNSLSDFQKSWNMYGQGKILTLSAINSYFDKLGNIIDFLNANQLGDRGFEQSIWDSWIELFGSPDTLRYPNVATNIFTRFDQTYRRFRFEVYPRIIYDFTNLEARCKSNGYVIASSADSLKHSSIFFVFINLFFMLVLFKN